MIVSLLLKSVRPIFAMSMPSTNIRPSAASMKRKKDKASVLLPLPMRFSCWHVVKYARNKTDLFYQEYQLFLRDLFQSWDCGVRLEGRADIYISVLSIVQSKRNEERTYGITNAEIFTNNVPFRENDIKIGKLTGRDLLTSWWPLGRRPRFDEFRWFSRQVRKFFHSLKRDLGRRSTREHDWNSSVNIPLIVPSPQIGGPMFSTSKQWRR